MAKNFKSYTPTSKLMEECFKLLLKSDEFIVIGESSSSTSEAQNILYKAVGPQFAADKLERWYKFMQEKAMQHGFMTMLLDESGIDNNLYEEDDDSDDDGSK